MKRYRTAIIGLGYIGNAHLEALFRIGQNVVAISDNNLVLAEKAAQQYGIDLVYENYKEMIKKENLDAVHICTPNHMHYDIAKYAIESNLHVFCEKPLALTSEQAHELTDLMEKSGKISAVNFNYRFYPVLQHARKMIKRGDIGKVHMIEGSYLQDWLLFDTDYNWRLDEKIGGKSRAIADIGSHWCDLAQHVTDLKITHVMADFLTLHETRKKPKGEIKTFDQSASQEEYEPVNMTTEDYAGVLIHFENGAKGIFCVSQVSAGEKCRIRLEMFGSKKSLLWDHEHANTLTIGERNEKKTMLTRDFSMNDGSDFVHYPAGHPEGYPDVVKNICLDFYASIENGRSSSSLPTFRHGLDQALIVDAILESNIKQKWVEVRRETDER